MSGVHLESPLPERMPAGSATALYCSGTATARSLELALGELRHKPRAVRMPRFDMAQRRSGFWSVVPFRAPEAPGTVEVQAIADGAFAALGEIEIVPGHEAAEPRAGLIAICMATFEPDLDLLAAQLDSIRAQSDSGWTCVISDDHSSPEHYAAIEALVKDDERFAVSRADERIGFYRNFERALTLAPPDAELVALCDQDDVWRVDRLAILRAALGSAMLVYSDQRLVDPSGAVLRNTLWRGRANNFTNIASLLVANTVTGASALFRREVGERAVPFPDTPGIDFHDHWIALVALASGEINYVDRPLYDYVQHPAAILGKVAGESRRRRRPGHLPRMREWRAAYFLGFIPGRMFALTLLMRCGALLTPTKRRALERYLASERSALAFVWLILRPLRGVFGRTETLGGEWELARGLVWRRAAGITASRWWPARVALDTQLPHAAQFEHRRLRRWRARALS